MSRIKLILLLILITGELCAQEAYEGCTLYSPNGSHNTYLLDMEGDQIHNWYSSNSGGYSSYLLEDGSVLRPVSAPNTSMQGGASSGRFERLNWDGDIVWQYDYHGTDYLPHHDIEPMPNGNILLIVWEIKTGAEVVANGRTSPITLWPDYLVEIEPSGTNGGDVVWEWHFWDHLIQDHDSTKLNYGVVEDHPELLDINLGGTGGGPGGGGGDWLHINGIDYNEELDQIVVSSHNLDEIFVIDHSTTTEEATGHTGGNGGMGGDILYRWGNADNYGADDSYNFEVVHCAYWVPSDCPGAGNLMAFNNGDNNHQSKVVEIEPPYENTYNYSWTPGTSFAPELPVWQYSNGTSFYSNHLGSVQRLPNGNTLICESTSGDMFEVDESGAIQWSKNTTSEIARCLRYGLDYPGLAALFPNGEITGTVTDVITSIAISEVMITIGDYEVESDADGNFSIEIPAGTYELTCEHEGYEFYEYGEDIELAVNQVIELEIELTPYGEISGTINDITTSAPIADVVIMIGEFEVESDADGNFSIEIPAGTYELTCEHEGYEFYEYGEDIELAANQVIDLEIGLTPYGEISGTVYDINTSAPIADVVIMIGEFEVESDADGNFSIEIPAGTYELTCEHEGYEDYEYSEDIILAANQVVDLIIELTPVSALNEDEINSTVLLGNYPNPFNPTTTISFMITDDNVNTELGIYNLKGQKVITLVDEQMTAGQKNVVWEGKDKYGNTVPSGIYLYKLTNGDHISTRKMILMK